MDELFSVDADARRKALTTAARHVRRQETGRPLLDDIRSKIEATQSVALPSSALSKNLPVRAHALESSRTLLPLRGSPAFIDPPTIGNYRVVAGIEMPSSVTCTVCALIRHWGSISVGPVGGKFVVPGAGEAVLFANQGSSSEIPAKFGR